MVGCFAANSSLESPVVGVRTGTAEIRAFAEQFSRFHASGAQLRHVLTNFATVGKTLSDAGLSIQSAHIDNYGERAVDAA